MFKSYFTPTRSCYRAELIRKLCVAYTNVFGLLCNQSRDCSASYTFVSRGLPTCQMLIRKHPYSFMMCVAKSGNAILKKKNKFLYSAVSSPQDRSKCFTLYFPDRPIHSDTISASLGSIQPYDAINARRLLIHISTTVYSHVLIYSAE